MNHSGKFHRVDVISTLKRVIDYRVKDLNDKYNLKGISSTLKKKNNYERLAHFNIIKPIMLKKLLEVRNNVGHKHLEPPSLKICQEHVEFVWYFLKSTDLYSQRVVDAFVLNMDSNDDSKYGIYVRPKIDNNWEIEFGGWLEKPYYASIPTSDFIKVEIIEKQTFIEFKNSIEDNVVMEDHHKGRFDSDLYIKTGFIENQEAKEALINKYFESNST